MFNSRLYLTGSEPETHRFVCKKTLLFKLVILFGPGIIIIHLIETVGQMLKSIMRFHFILDCVHQEMDLFFQFDLEKNCTDKKYFGVNKNLSLKYANRSFSVGLAMKRFTNHLIIWIVFSKTCQNGCPLTTSS